MLNVPTYRPGAVCSTFNSLAFKSGPTTMPAMFRKFRNWSFLSNAEMITRTWPSEVSVATANLPASAAGRIDQRTIWLKSLS